MGSGKQKISKQSLNKQKLSFGSSHELKKQTLKNSVPGRTRGRYHEEIFGAQPQGNFLDTRPGCRFRFGYFAWHIAEFSEFVNRACRLRALKIQNDLNMYTVSVMPILGNRSWVH